MNPRRTLILLSLVAVLTTQCSRYSYYMPPFHSVDHPYRQQLLRTDSVKKATFINAAISGAGYNDELVDGAWFLQSSIYNTHKFGILRGWYGATLGLGQYDIDNYQGYNAFGNTDPDLINANAGTTFYGGIGAFGGLSVAAKIGEKSEWRVLNIETSYLKEFGNYLQFRNKLSDSTVDAYYDHNYFWTFALGTEIASKTKHGDFAFKINVFGDVNRMKGYFENNGFPVTNPRLSGTSMSFHFSKYTTGYNFTWGLGSYSLFFQFGMNFRLGYL